MPTSDLWNDSTWNGPASGAVAPAPPALGDRQLLGRIAQLLRLTREFDEVATTGPPEEKGQSAGDAKLCCLELAGFDEESARGSEESLDRTVAFTLMVLVRDEDPDVRDDEADRLLNVAANAIDGQSLGNVCYADDTRLKRGKWLPATGPERRVVAMGQFAYEVSGYQGHSTTGY